MASAQIVSEEHSRTEGLHSPLISGLPDDIAILCLARVPRSYHHVVRCVSRRWNALISREEWVSCRHRNNLEETWIYAFCKDNATGKNCIFVLDPVPGRRNWKALQIVPPQCHEKVGMSLELLGKKLYLLGGSSLREDATDEVHCYDALANKWQRGLSMPTTRCNFVSAVLDKKLFISGGNVTNSAAPESWDVYDSHSNSWSSHMISMPVHDIQKIIPLDGKIYTIHKAWNFRYVGVFDPLCNSWKRANDDIASRFGPTVVIDGTLYMLDESSGTRLMMWRKETEEWVALGRLSHQLTRPPCQLVAIGRSIFVIGRGLSTVVVDVDMAAKVEGMLVTSSFFPKFALDLSIISCKTIAI